MNEQNKLERLSLESLYSKTGADWVFYNLRGKLSVSNIFWIFKVRADFLEVDHFS